MRYYWKQNDFFWSSEAKMMPRQSKRSLMTIKRLVMCPPKVLFGVVFLGLGSLCLSLVFPCEPASLLGTSLALADFVLKFLHFLFELGDFATVNLFDGVGQREGRCRRRVNPNDLNRRVRRSCWSCCWHLYHLRRLKLRGKIDYRRVGG